MEALKVFSLILLLYSCGLALPKEEASTLNREEKLSSGILTGKFSSIDGSEIDLSTDPSKIQILMFVSETCTVCRKETLGLIADLATRGIPTNVSFYSFVVGAYPEDAISWKDSLNVTWPVGLQEGDAIFRNYCPELLTPCVILRNPNTSSITKLVGEHSIAEWEKITGNWSH